MRTEFITKFSKNNEGPFKDTATVLTADTFQKDDQGQTPFQKLEKVPEVFHLVKIAPLILVGIVLFSSVALVLLYDQRRRGLRAVGIILVGNGLFILIGTLLLTYLFAQANKPDGSLVKVTGDNLFQNTIINIIRSLNSALNQSLFKFCAAYIFGWCSHINYPQADKTLKNSRRMWLVYRLNPARLNYLHRCHTEPNPSEKVEKPKKNKAP